MNTSFVCLLCKEGDGFLPVAGGLRDDPDRRFAVVRCAACGHTQLWPRPNADEFRAFIEDDQQAKRLYRSSDLVETLLLKKRPDSKRRLAWLASRFPEPKDVRVIEVESGYGLFVNDFAMAGYESHGLEASSYKMGVAKSRMQGHFHEGPLDCEFTTKFADSFDAVMLYHRLVHDFDPVDYIRRLLLLLKSTGALYIEEPNLDDEMMREIPNYARHRWQTSHLNYFDANHLKQAIVKAGAVRFEIYGLQRYGLRHLLKWTDEGAPNLAPPADYPASALLDRAETNYRREREQNLTSDSLVAIVRRAA